MSNKIERAPLVTNDATNEFTPVASEDKRRIGRKSIYASDAIKGIVHTSKQTLAGFCRDLSPEGVGIVFDVELPVTNFQLDASVQVEIQTPLGRSLTLKGVIVAVSPVQQQGDHFHLVCIHFSEPALDDISTRRRIGNTFTIQEFLQPQAYADDPVFFGDMLIFRVAALGPKGCTLLTSARNKGIVPGIPLNLTLVLPNLGERTIEAVPLRIKPAPGNANYYLLEVEFKTVNPFFSEAASEFILMSCPGVTIKDLRENGFLVVSTANALTVTSPQNEADHRKILELRFAAYKAVGKFQDKLGPEEMRDEFDSYSRQLVCKIGGVTVGAIRVVFVGGDRTRSEHASIGIDVPDFLFKGGFVELSRACTDSRFRGSDVFYTLVQHCIRLTRQAGMRYVVANCNPELWPMYKKLGAKKVGKKFEGFGRTDCQLICFEASRVIDGMKGDFFALNQVVLPVSRFWNRNRSIFDRVRFLRHEVLHVPMYPLIKRLRVLLAYRKHKNKSKRD